MQNVEKPEKCQINSRFCSDSFCTIKIMLSSLFAHFLYSLLSVITDTLVAMREAVKRCSPFQNVFQGDTSEFYLKLSLLAYHFF